MDIISAVDRYTHERTLAGLSKSSIDEYARNLYNFAEFLDARGLNDSTQVTGEHVRDWLFSCMRRNQQATLCHKRSIAKLWIEWLNSNKLCSADLSAIPQVSPPHPDEIRRLQVTDTQVADIFAHLASGTARRAV